MEGVAAAQFSKLSRGNMGTARVRRTAGTRWTALEKFREMILAGDIGGTHARLSYYQQADNGDFVAVHEHVFESREFRGLNEVVARFVSETGVHPTIATFGIAGPVR